MQGGGMLGNFAKSKARLNQDGSVKTVTFKDVAGLKEEKEDLARFGSYCDSTHIQERMTDIRRELYCMPEMNAYLESYSELNKMLDEITDIVFDDISDELAKGRIGRSYARYSR